MLAASTEADARRPGISRSTVFQGAPLAHSAEAAARRIGVGRTKIFELIGNGRLKAIKCDGRTLITEAALVEFLASLPSV
jgi:excisionase family DNA binding protein